MLSDQPNLFRDNVYRAVLLKVETVERKVIDRYVTVAGVRFELEDLYETLCEIEGSTSIYVTDRDRYKVLVDIGVLGRLGGRGYAASEGENFKDFLERVRAAYYRDRTHG